MPNITWEEIAREFSFDGSWLDIYVVHPEIAAWQRLFDRLRQSGLEISYSSYGDRQELPQAASAVLEAASKGGGRFLSIKIEGVGLNCDFLGDLPEGTQDAIYFYFDPRDVKGQLQLDALLGFLLLLSDVAGKEAAFAGNAGGVFRAHPGRIVEYEPPRR